MKMEREPLIYEQSRPSPSCDCFLDTNFATSLFLFKAFYNKNVRTKNWFNLVNLKIARTFLIFVIVLLLIPFSKSRF